METRIFEYPTKAKPQREEDGIFSYRGGDGQTKYLVRVECRGEQLRKFGFPTITKARLWRDSRKGRAAEGRLFPEQEQAEREAAAQRIPFFREYSKSWFQGCKAKRLKQSTLRSYDQILNRHLIPAFGGERLDGIKRPHVRELAVALHRAKAAPKTVHNVVRVLSAIFEQGNEDELVAYNPARKPSRLVKKGKGKLVEVFTEEEETLILTAAKERLSEYHIFLLSLFRTGMREGEAVALMPEDIDLRSRYILVQRNFASGLFLEDTPKSGKMRKVDLASDLHEALKEHLTLRDAEAALTGENPPPWLFGTPGGSIINTNHFRDRVWRPFLKTLNMRYRNVHAIRHTFATRLIMRGASPVYVSKQLGHSSIKITVDLYTHWIEETERSEGLERCRRLEIDRLLDGPCPTQVVTKPVT